MSDSSTRRGAAAEATFLFRFDGIEVDEAAWTIRRDGEALKLERRAFQLLVVLLQHAGEVISKAELFEWVWLSRSENDNALQNAVGKVRKALGPETGRRVETVAGHGDRFTGPLQRIAIEAAPAAASHLGAGDPVWGRPGFRLETRLGGARSQTWLARGPGGQCRVFKYAFDAEGLRSLKRERTLSRYLRESLGDREEFCFTVGENFEQPPCFLEFEHVGTDLLTWQRAGGPLAAMTLAQRVELILPVVTAVAAAHDLAVLHKDIKPANILLQARVDGGWKTCLADFGSGHAVDAERIRALGLTVMGVTIDATDALGLSGTLSYMAPEVLAGQPATVQSDIYALGVVLFQVVVGNLQRPLAPGWEREVDDELLRADILAATDGDPRARLSNARELRDRLLSLDARRTERAERLRQQEQARQAMAELERRRSRRPWVLAALATLSLGLVASLSMYYQAQQALKWAHEQTERATAIGQFLHGDVLAASDSIVAGAVIRQQTLLDLLQKAAEAAPTRFAGQPVTEAVVHRRLGQTFMKLASLVHARVQLTRAIELLEAQHVSEDDPELLTARFLLARMLGWMEDLQSARTMLEAGERSAGRQRLEEATELSYIAARARFEIELGEHQDAAALTTARRLVKLADQAFLPGSEQQVDARQRLAHALVRQHLEDQANDVTAELTRAPFLLRTAPLQFKSNMLIDQTDELRHQGRWNEALQAIEQAAKLMNSPDGVINPFTLAWCEAEHSEILARKGRFDAAMNAIDSAHQRFRTIFGEDHQYTIGTRVQMAYLLLETSTPQAALEAFEAVERQHKAVYAPRRPFGPEVDFGMALALLDLGRFSEAMGLLDGVDGVKLARDLDAADAEARLAFAKGRALVGLGQLARGRAMMVAALAALEGKVTADWMPAKLRAQLRLASGS